MNSSMYNNVSSRMVSERMYGRSVESGKRRSRQHEKACGRPIIPSPVPCCAMKTFPSRRPPVESCTYQSTGINRAVPQVLHQWILSYLPFDNVLHELQRWSLLSICTPKEEHQGEPKLKKKVMHEVLLPSVSTSWLPFIYFKCCPYSFTFLSSIIDFQF